MYAKEIVAARIFKTPKEKWNISQKLKDIMGLEKMSKIINIKGQPQPKQHVTHLYVVERLKEEKKMSNKILALCRKEVVCTKANRANKTPHKLVDSLQTLNFRN